MNTKVSELNTRQINALHKSLMDRTTSKVQIRTIQTGREQYGQKFIEMLENVKQNNQSYSKFLIADYGVGKTFLIEMLLDIAKTDNFLVAKVDLSPDRLLYHDKKAIATYSAMMANLECKGSKNAIDKLFQDVCKQALDNVGSINSRKISEEIMRINQNIKAMQYGEVFIKVLINYAIAYFEDDQLTMSNCLKWVKGEYENKTHISRDLKIDTKIDASNYRQFLMLINELGKSCGYNGLVTFFDECVNIKDANHITRKKNLETILTMFNETTQGEIESCIYFFAGDLEFLTNERKGLYSYDALKQRINNEDLEYIDLDSNIWRVKYLTVSQQIELSKIIVEVYERKFDKSFNVSNSQIENYINDKNSGMNFENIVTRDVISGMTQRLNKINNGDYTSAEAFSFIESSESINSGNTVVGLDDAF